MLEIDKKKKSNLHKEIDAIISKNDGMVTKELIVKAAQKKGTALHESFVQRGLFDPAKAVKFAQLTYAGMILQQYKVWVTVNEGDPVKVRALVSLTSDRKVDGAFRPIVNVMSDKDQRFTMLADAKKEMSSFQKKYAVLSELAPVFEAMKSI